MFVEIAVFADYATTAVDGKLVVGGIFNVLFASAVPLKVPALTMAVRIAADSGEPRDHVLTIRMAAPSELEGQRLLEVPFSLPEESSVPLAPPAAQFVVTLQALVFEHEGRYAFDLLVDGKYLRTATLYVAPRPDESKDA